MVVGLLLLEVLGDATLRGALLGHDEAIEAQAAHGFPVEAPDQKLDFPLGGLRVVDVAVNFGCLLELVADHGNGGI